MNRTLVIIGVLIVIVGVAWPLFGKLPLSRLPGDIVIDRPGFRAFVPLTTMLLISVVVSLLLWLFRR